MNTARAGLVDERALLQALEQGTVGFYATDVYASEPPEVDDLLRHESTITTPHIGAYTRESMDRAAEAETEARVRRSRPLGRRGVFRGSRLPEGT